MGVLAYSTLFVGVSAVYIGYSSSRQPTQTGIFSIKKYWKAYSLGILATLVGLGFGITSLLSGEFISAIVAFLSGPGSLILVGVIAVLDIGSKAAKEGTEAAKAGAEFAKENPEAAAEIAKASAGVAEAAGEAAESLSGNSGPVTKNSQKTTNKSSDSQKDSRDKIKEEIRDLYENAFDVGGWMNQEATNAPLTMRCSNCGIPWAIIEEASPSMKGYTRRLKKENNNYDKYADFDGDSLYIGVNPVGTDTFGETRLQCMYCNEQESIRIDN